jgi:hypothetical protein
MERGFRFLAGTFAVLLALPAMGLLVVAVRGAIHVRPADLALAGILFTAAMVIASALASRSRSAILASAAFVTGSALVAFAVAPSAGPGWPQDAALGGFLAAGAAALALCAPAKGAQRTSTVATDS